MAELIVALDFNSADKALSMGKTLQGHLPWVKIGLELFISQGPSIIEKFKKMGYKVFLDLKLYDIPNTVAGAVHAAASTGADMLTIHLSGGERMCQAAMDSAHKFTNPPLIFGVSVLTSFAEGEVPAYEGTLENLTALLAKGASDWRLNGIVSSAHELSTIKNINSNLLCLAPGIRLASNSNDDQRRVMTPDMALHAGADFLVVGRPITQAPDPVDVAQHIQSSISTYNS